MINRGSQTEPKKKSKRFYLILFAAVVLFLIVSGLVVLKMFETSQPSYGPGPVGIEVVSDKTVYLQGEEVNFAIYVNNPEDWPVRHPSAVDHQLNKDSEFIYSDHVEKDGGDPWPAFPAHSRTLYETYKWDQKAEIASTRTLVPPGNYTFTVSFFHGQVDYGNIGSCSFEIRQNPP